jgi:hypothetical protein
VTVGVITVILDGVAAKQLANQWAMAPPSEKPVALSVVSANERINFTLVGLFNMSFAGVPFILFGLAVRSARPTHAGWAGRPRRPESGRAAPASSRLSQANRPWRLSS